MASALLSMSGQPVVFNFTLETVLVEGEAPEGEGFVGPLPQELLQPASIFDLREALLLALASVPQVPPDGGGIWNNNGMLCMSETSLQFGPNGGVSLFPSQRELQPACLADAVYILQTLLDGIPTSLPSAAGVVWNNNGVLCVS